MVGFGWHATNSMGHAATLVLAGGERGASQEAQYTIFGRMQGRLTHLCLSCISARLVQVMDEAGTFRADNFEKLRPDQPPACDEVATTSGRGAEVSARGAGRGRRGCALCLEIGLHALCETSRFEQHIKMQSLQLQESFRNGWCLFVHGCCARFKGQDDAEEQTL